MSDMRIACDIGGTFTDFVVIDERNNTYCLEKVLTTQSNPSQGIFNGIVQLERNEKDLTSRATMIVHGTTLVINALIERRGSLTALVTTNGFRDVLEMRDGLRYDVYDLQIEYPKPLVPRWLRFEVPERVLADGSVLHPLDEAATQNIITAIIAAGVKSVAVCLLHAYANPVHEQRIAALLKQRAPNITVSLASDILPQINEYQRTSTVVANAFVKPKVAAYLDQITHGLAERHFEGEFYVMQSAGGIMESSVAHNIPIQLLESGPAGGVAGAIWWARHSGLTDLLCFDMGGTTAKLCPATHGAALVTDEYEAGRTYRFKRGSGFPVNVPVLDLLEIGTGGGSIAHIDSLGLLKVGPESASSSPGPASYALGGVRPTVTDADLILGYLNPLYFLGGGLALRPELAYAAIERHVARRLNLSVEEAADGIYQLANENMAAAARLHLAERGQDPERLALVAYGGAGPVHACGLAERLGCKILLVPPAAGVMSALGMLVADLSMNRQRTLKILLHRLTPEIMSGMLDQLQEELRTLLSPERSNREVILMRYADMRYVGQGHSVRVRLPHIDSDAAQLISNLKTAFDAAYRHLYGRVYDDVQIELIDLCVTGQLNVARPFEPPALPAADDSCLVALKDNRKSYFGVLGGFIECKVFDRYLLRPGHVIEGPAVIEERETSTVVTPGARLTIDAFGTLIIRFDKE